MYECKVIADSITETGVRLTTLCLPIPRFVLPEFNTHRKLSRNSASSRAIPVSKNILKVANNPFIPHAFAKNKKGMQEGESLEGSADQQAKAAWLTLRDAAVETAKTLEALEVHKHWGNRPLELFNDQTLVVTSTDWRNFLALRRHIDAAPEMRYTADAMLQALQASVPELKGVGGMHLPYVYAEDRKVCTPEELVKLSVARCARVSALTHEGVRSLDADYNLYNRLASSGHMSPLEHVAKVANEEEIRKYALYRYVGERFGHQMFEAVSIGNFDVPWLQHRKTIPNEDVFQG